MSSPDRLGAMPDASQLTSSADNLFHQHSAALEHMKKYGFEEQDVEYLVAAYRVRKVNRILASGSDYGDPFAWELAVERARAEEKNIAERLVREHGYPETAGLEWREAHQKNLRFLMGKYPSADWDLLLRSQYEGRDRKPTPPKYLQVTVQVIERTKNLLVGLTQQREELNAYGEAPATVARLDKSISRFRREAERYGVDANALLEENRQRCLPVPLVKEEAERIAQRVAEMELNIADMQAQRASDDEESELLTATRRVLNTYQDGLKQFGVDAGSLPATELVTVLDSITPALPAPRSGVRPASTPQVAPVPHPVSTPEPQAPTRTVTSNDEKLLSAREAAQVVGIAYNTMLTELKSGRFPFANLVGGKWRISRKGLNDWLQGHRQDVETLKQDTSVVLKVRGKKTSKPAFVRPDGKPLSF